MSAIHPLRNGCSNNWCALVKSIILFKTESSPSSQSNLMHVHIRERLPVSTEVEFEAPDLPHSCSRKREVFSDDTRIGGAPSSLVPPGTAPCLPTGPARSDKSVKLANRKASAALFRQVVMEGESLESVCASTQRAFDRSWRN